MFAGFVPYDLLNVCANQYHYHVCFKLLHLPFYTVPIATWLDNCPRPLRKGPHYIF